MKSEVLSKFVAIIGVLMVTGYGLDGRSSSPDKKSTGKRLEFRIVIAGNIIDQEATTAGFQTTLFPEGTNFGFTLFEASDGGKLLARDGRFRSPEEAKRYFDWSLAKSSKVLKQGVKTDSRGKSVGYRAEVLLAPDQKQSAVMWTNGPYFYQITSESLADALELEKR
ncbi:MAG TPA: hypothetical protein VKO18_02040 [Terriglobia bacterium]|nr:hypothetical protein [Terriglobia bacterium]